MTAPKIPRGYVLQPRKLDHSEVSKLSPVTRELWSYLIRNVNHRDNGIYMRGQGFINLGNIQDQLCWYAGFRKCTYSKPRLTKALGRLRELRMIASTKATRGLVVTVLNYDFYQNPKNYEGNTEGSTKAQGKNNSRHTKNKKVEEQKEEEKVNTLLVAEHKGIPTIKDVEDWAMNKARELKTDQASTVRKALQARSTYLDNDWRNSKDKPIQNWKASIQNNWFGELPPEPKTFKEQVAEIGMY